MVAVSMLTFALYKAGPDVPIVGGNYLVSKKSNQKRKLTNRSFHMMWS